MGVLVLAYSIVVYFGFFAAFLYLVVFMGGDMTGFIGAPKTIDAGASPFASAPPALVNIGLLALFGLQHTIMARPGFKRAWTKIVPEAAERSTYVLATNLVLVALFVYWIPMPAVIWSIEPGIWSGVMTALFLLGVGIVFISTFLINHFDLFGLLQAWSRFKGAPPPSSHFVTPALYKYVRHPLYLGFLIAFWSTSHMTAGHLLFASVWSIYIFIALGYEERDMIAHFGDQYRDYMAKVPMIMPFGRRKK